MNCRHLGIVFVMLCCISITQTMMIPDNYTDPSIFKDSVTPNISDEHKKTVRNMLQDAYRTYKEPSWPDLHEDDIKVTVDKDRIRASGIVDLSNCIMHDVSYPEIEVRIHHERIEVTEPYGIIGDAKLKCWAMASLSCLLGVAGLLMTPFIIVQELPRLCRKGTAENAENHQSKPDPSESLDRLRNHFD